LKTSSKGTLADEYSKWKYVLILKLFVDMEYARLLKLFER